MPEQHSGKRGQSMDYKLVISEHADELLDNLVYYLLYRLKSEQAARHLLDGIDMIYDNLIENPYQYPLCIDQYLAKKYYRNAIVSQMNYSVVYDIKDNEVNVLGIFHQLENIRDKL